MAFGDIDGRWTRLCCECVRACLDVYCFLGGATPALPALFPRKMMLAACVMCRRFEMIDG